MIAILSDIHGNLEALQAVLDDVSRMQADTIICLGDVIGYGPDPIPCLELAMTWETVLRGNFDDALLQDRELKDWMPRLQKMIEQVREEVAQHPNGKRITNFLTTCSTIHFDNGTMFVHGSPRDHLHEYIFPEHAYEPQKMADVFQMFDQLCFCGHTHVAGIFTTGTSSSGNIHTYSLDYLLPKGAHIGFNDG